VLKIAQTEKNIKNGDLLVQEAETYERLAGVQGLLKSYGLVNNMQKDGTVALRLEYANYGSLQQL
jgi:hypothetical protein